MKTLKQLPAKTRMLRAVATGLMWVSATGTAQTFNVLKSFGDLTHVTGFPSSQLVQGADGALYGTASEGAGNLRGAQRFLPQSQRQFPALAVSGFHPLIRVRVVGDLALDGVPQQLAVKVDRH